MGSQDWGMGFLALFALTDHRMNERLKRNYKGRGEAGGGVGRLGGGGEAHQVCVMFIPLLEAKVRISNFINPSGVVYRPYS
jgi:hypothetical protein